MRGRVSRTQRVHVPLGLAGFAAIAADVACFFELALELGVFCCELALGLGVFCCEVAAVFAFPLLTACTQKKSSGVCDSVRVCARARVWEPGVSRQKRQSHGRRKYDMSTDSYDYRVRTEHTRCRDLPL